METDYAAPRDGLRILVETASEYEGIRAARLFDPAVGEPFDPGHRWGRILAYAWPIDPDLVLFSGVSYIAGVRAECDRLQRRPPAWDEVVDHLAVAIDPGRYPEIVVDDLGRFIRGQVPHLYGARI